MIRLLEERDAAHYLALRREALLDSPLAFASSPEDDVAANVEQTAAQLRAAPDSVILGAWEGALVGAVGLLRDRHLKAGHKAMLWGMYVTASRRRHGVGGQLLGGIIEHALGLAGVDFIELGVTSSAPDALRLYERAGFRAWGIEPEALRHRGESVSETHMSLDLRLRRAG